MKPIRVQRKRTKGYRLPPNTVSVCRPGKFGNPFKPDQCRASGYEGTELQIKQRCVSAFRAWLCDKDGWLNWQGDEAERAKAAILDNLESLRGKNLACYCKLDEPCHADVLLELANRPIRCPDCRGCGSLRVTTPSGNLFGHGVCGRCKGKGEIDANESK